MKAKAAKAKNEWSGRVIRLRAAGTVYIIISIVLGVVAITTSNNLYYLITAMMLGYMLASGLAGRSNIRRASVSVSFPDEIYASVPCAAQINVSNKNRFAPIFLIEVALGQEKGKKCAFFPIIQPGCTESRTVFITFPSRGQRSFNDVELTSSFPFNFFVRYWPVNAETEITVFPQPLACEPEAALADRDEEGKISEVNPLAETDIVGVRPYAEGDSMKRIHWKSSARTGKLQARLYDGESSLLPPRIIDLDRLTKNGFERGLSMAAFIIVESIKSKLPVGMRSGSTLTLPASGYAHKKDLLTQLALYEER